MKKWYYAMQGLFQNCQYMVMGGAVIYFYFHLGVFDCNFMTFYSIFIWVLVIYSWFKNMSNSNCSWYSNSLKTCFWSDWVDIISLQYVYCNHYDSNSFSDMTQFSLLQEAWVTYVCYSSWSSSQFHVEILCCHHVHLHKYTYCYYAEGCQSLQNRCLISSAVVLMDTIEFTYDSYNFLNNWSSLHYIPIFYIAL